MMTEDCEVKRKERVWLFLRAFTFQKSEFRRLGISIT